MPPRAICIDLLHASDISAKRNCNRIGCGSFTRMTLSGTLTAQKPSFWLANFTKLFTSKIQWEGQKGFQENTLSRVRSSRRTLTPWG